MTYSTLLISQLLLPFFRKELSALKFLHIVRDGRDVALSNNQSPVEKFYSNYYEDASDREASMKLDDFGEQTRNRVKAIQLWNDWNKQVYEYGIQNSDGNTFDVLVMRTEDFLDHPFESLFQLADFVGSPKTPHEICCISLKATKDFGKSDANSAPAGPYVRIPDYQQIREHFQKFSPSKPFDEIKEPVFANAHKGASYIIQWYTIPSLHGPQTVFYCQPWKAKLSGRKAVFGIVGSVT